MCSEELSKKMKKMISDRKMMTTAMTKLTCKVMREMIREHYAKKGKRLTYLTRMKRDDLVDSCAQLGLFDDYEDHNQPEEEEEVVEYKPGDLVVYGKYRSIYLLTIYEVKHITKTGRLSMMPIKQYVWTNRAVDYLDVDVMERDPNKACICVSPKNVYARWEDGFHL